MKTIPSQLLTHKAGETTTLCRLWKIKKDTILFGFTNLDIDVSYDDASGDGVLTYRSLNGFQMSRLASTVGTGVDNYDITGITVELDTLGVTEHQVRSGALDFADQWVYEVNYNDLTAGRHEIIDRGKSGQAELDGDQYKLEGRSLTQLLKQSAVPVTSVSCRAIFASQPYGTGGGVVEEKYPCGKTRTWVSATITAVSGTEADRIITCSSLAQAAGYFVPGKIRVTSGDNDGREEAVVNFSGGVITLALPLYYSFQVGDTLDISQDCSKIYEDADHGCLYHWGTTDRNLHFRGEHLLPLGREDELLTPGAME